jgi:hypothetical protein
MTGKRKQDREPRAWFRSNRFFKNDDKWYFSTREGTLEGPFWDQAEAEKNLKAYIKIMNSGYMPEDSKLDLVPLETEDN